MLSPESFFSVLGILMCEVAHSNNGISLKVFVFGLCSKDFIMKTTVGIECHCV
ncbi:hypothetical protein H0X06_01900 [Candidatus Dependentiae bacterium]|nr:hypothetical protein [Candidatus Dependentiae bacterium]